MTINDNGLPAQYQLNRHRVGVTFFDNFAAKTKRYENPTLPEMGDQVLHENRARKNLLPWFKLAIFGEVRTAKGSLRHDANVLQITGVENEHDSGKMSFDEAASLLRAAGVRCLIYTSPSHLIPDENGVAVEKWRVMSPTSQPLPAAMRAQLAARVNGVIKGASTAESFTLSQSFYYGSVARNPEHRVEVIDGDSFIDLCDDLDAGAIAAPAKLKKDKPALAQPAGVTPGYVEADLDELIATANRVDANGDRQWHTNMRSVTASMVQKMKSDDEIRERCAGACEGGKYDDDLTVLINTARDKWGIPDPATSSAEFSALLADFADEAKASGIEAPGFRSKDRARLTVEDFYAFLPTHQYIFRHTGELWLAAGVNAALGKVKVGTERVKLKKAEKADADGPDEFRDEDVLIPASLWLDTHRPVAQMSWVPGAPQIITGEITIEGGIKAVAGASIFNLYIPPVRRPGHAEAAGKWLWLVHEVYPDHADHIIKFMAHRIQRPGEKINHALVLTGSPGIGKDTMLEPLKHGVGAWNFKEISPADITDKHNDYMKSVAMRVSEARDLGDTNRFAQYEAMKTILAAPPDMVRINTKYVPQYYAVNVTGAVITTNYPTDGLYLPADDRRHYVCGTEAKKEDFDPDTWTEIWNWYADGGLDHVVAYLAGLDLSGFDPKAPPEKTAAFWRMSDGGMSSEVPEMRDVIDKLGTRLADGSVVPPAAVTLEMVCRACSDSADGLYEWLRNRSNRRVIPHRMESCGYTPVRNPSADSGLWVIGGKRQVVYGLMSSDLPTRIKAATALTKDSNPKKVP